MSNYEKSLETANEELSNRLEKALVEKETLLKVLFLTQYLFVGKTDYYMKYKTKKVDNQYYSQLVKCLKDDEKCEYVLFDKSVTDLIETLIGSDEIQEVLEANEEAAKRMRDEVFQTVSDGLYGFD